MSMPSKQGYARFQELVAKRQNELLNIRLSKEENEKLKCQSDRALYLEKKANHARVKKVS